MLNLQKRKKSLFALLLVLLLGASLSLSSCGDKAEESEGESEGSLFEALYDYDMNEYVKLGKYLGVETAPMEEPEEISDEEVQEEVQNRLMAEAKEELIMDDTTPVQEGDSVSIDYVGRMDGEEFDGGTGSTNLVIGSGNFIEGFEEGLIGHNKGEEVVLNLNFPDPYQMNEELSGKPVEFTVTIKGITRTTTPEYDVDFVKSVSEANSIAEYEALVKEELIEAAKEAAESAWENDIWSQIVDDSEILLYPEKEKTGILDQYNDYYQRLAENYGFGDDFDGFLEAMSVSREQYDEDANAYAESVMKNEMVLFAVAQKEDLLLTDEDYRSGIKDLIERSGFESAEAFEEAYGTSYEEYVGKDNVVVSLTMEKVWEKIKDELVINEKLASPTEEDEE